MHHTEARFLTNFPETNPSLAENISEIWDAVHDASSINGNEGVYAFTSASSLLRVSTVLDLIDTEK